MQVRLLIAFLLVGCGGTPPPLHEIGEPNAYRGHVTVIRGSAYPQANDSCTVTVSRTDDDRFNCRIYIECSRDVLYGLGDGGFNHCEEANGALAAASDRNGTRIDGDPRLFLDLVGMRVVVSDDDPDFDLEIDLHDPEASASSAPQETP